MNGAPDAVDSEAAPDPWREQDTVSLLVLAQRDPLAALRALLAGDGLLAQAVTLAAEEFDPYTASQCTAAAAALLGVIGSALKAHALAPAPKVPKRQRAVTPRAATSDEVPF